MNRYNRNYRRWVESRIFGRTYHDQTKHVKNGGHTVRRRVSKNFKIGPSLSFCRTKCLFKIWANESIQQELSAMGRKQNIWQNIAMMADTSAQHCNAKTNFTKNYSFTEDSVNTDNTVSLLNA